MAWENERRSEAQRRQHRRAAVGLALDRRARGRFAQFRSIQRENGGKDHLLGDRGNLRIGS